MYLKEMSNLVCSPQILDGPEIWVRNSNGRSGDVICSSVIAVVYNNSTVESIAFKSNLLNWELTTRS
jgi:hypothetical protein